MKRKKTYIRREKKWFPTRDRLTVKNNFIIKLLLLFIFLSACSKETNTDSYTTSTDSQDSAPVELPEPSVEGVVSSVNGTVKIARFKLTQLAAVEEKILKINDSIVFTGLNKQLQMTDLLEKIKLKITSHCIINKGKVIIKEFERPLSQSIPIIELLPEEVLTYQANNYPSCGFSFKAENKKGDAHHFELPQLPIVDYIESRFIQLKSSSEKKGKYFYYVFMQNISDYWVDTGHHEMMDNLRLVCSNFSFNLKVRSQQVIPLAVFPFNELSEEIKQAINLEAPDQQCRIFGYREQTLVGASHNFYLSYPRSKLEVFIENDRFKGKELSFYTELINPDGTLKQNRPDVPLFSYIIENTHPYPVHLLLDNYQKKKRKKKLSLKFYGLYHLKKARMSFYRLHSSTFYIGNVQHLKGQSSDWETEEGILIKLEPKSKIKIPVVLKDPSLDPRYPRLCAPRRVEEDAGISWLGAVVKYPDFKIYQLASGQMDLIPLSQNILHQLDNQYGNGEGFNILTDHLTSSRANFDYLWFKRGRCKGKIIAKTDTPLLELYWQGSIVKTKWIESTPPDWVEYINKEQKSTEQQQPTDRNRKYHQTEQTIYKLLYGEEGIRGI